MSEEAKNHIELYIFRKPISYALISYAISCENQSIYQQNQSKGLL